MTKKQRIEYLAVTLCVFISAFLIYAFLGNMQSFGNEDKIQSFLLYGLLGGYGFSSILSGIILFVRFISKKSLIFKIMASVFWPISLAGLFYIGVLGYIPYQIYNVVKIIQEKPFPFQ